MTDLDFVVQLETVLQRSADAVRNDSDSLATMEPFTTSPAFERTSPCLLRWLRAVLFDGGHENEHLIGVANWSDIDAACGLTASLAMNEHTLTLACSQFTESLVKVFGTYCAWRLRQLSAEQLVRESGK